MSRFTQFVALGATAACVLTACSGTVSSSSSTSAPATSSASAASASQLKVMASFYPLQYLVQEIGASLVSVESLTPAGAEPHDLELTPQSVQQLSSAGAVIYLKGFQSAVDEAVASNPPKNVVDVSGAVQLVPEETPGHDTELDTDVDDHDDHDADDHHHDHNDMDPHFWLDPIRMGQAATAIGQGLAQADPANAQIYTANADKVKKAMDELGNELVTGTAHCASQTFVTSHEAFGYLADRTGLKQLGISGLDPDSSPSPARLQRISDIVKAQGVTTIFTEALLNPKVAETLARDLGITTAVLDPIESQADASQDYTAVMKANIQALRTALSCQ